MREVRGGDLTRRSLLTHLGLASIGLTQAGAVGGAEKAAAADEPAQPYGRASFSPRGGFDLDDPGHRRLARLKLFNSLDGSKTYFYTVTRHILCPPGEAPYPLHAEMELNTIWLERAPGMTEDEAIVRALFTRTPLDPFSFEPVTGYYNPYLDRNLFVADTLFGGSGFKVSLDPEAPVSPVIQSDEPHYRIGADIAFIMFDPRAGSGAFQPRVDTVVWRTDYAALMDPGTAHVEAEHNYSAVLKASTYPWSGIPDGDAAQMLTMKTGRKLCAFDDLPREVQDLIVAKYPERV